MKEVERHKLNPASASSSRETQREKGKVFRVCKFCGSFFWKHSVVFNKFFLPSFVKLFFEEVCEFSNSIDEYYCTESFQNNFKVWEPLKAWQSYKLMGASRVRQKHQQTLDVNRNWWRPTLLEKLVWGCEALARAQTRAAAWSYRKPEPNRQRKLWRLWWDQNDMWRGLANFTEEAVGVEAEV